MRKLTVGLICLWAGFWAASAGAQVVRIPGEPVPAEFAIGIKPGHPLDTLPAGTRLLSAFGERPVFSPDGRKIAFVNHAHGDAFEYDLSTGRIRNLTGHTAHAGIFRVHYLRDGSFLFSAAAQHGLTAQQARGQTALYWMDAAGDGLLKPLNQRLMEGVAVSRTSNKVAWARWSPDGKSPAEPGAAGTSTLFVGEFVKAPGGEVRLDNVREVLTKPWSDCLLEAQDFTAGDAAVVAPCYRVGRDEKGPRFELGVLSVDLADRKVINYPLPVGYHEVEGVFPDGKRALVECGNDNRVGLDLCLLELKPTAPAYSRLTFAQDYGNYRFANAVVSPDGRRMVFHYGLASDEAGTGRGILMTEFPAGF